MNASFDRVPDGPRSGHATEDPGVVSLVEDDGWKASFDRQDLIRPSSERVILVGARLQHTLVAAPGLPGYPTLPLEHRDEVDEVFALPWLIDALSLLIGDDVGGRLLDDGMTPAGIVEA